MPKYMIQGSYTAEGVRGLQREGGSARRSQVQAMVESVGGSLECCYFALGEDDVVCIVDVPDNVAATAISIAVGASGAVSIRSTALLTAEDVDKAVGSSVDYRPPGG